MTKWHFGKFISENVRYESDVEGGMVRISEMRAFSNHPYHVEKDAAMLELVDSIEAAGKVHKEEVSKINTKFRNQIKKLKKELDFWRLATGVLLIVSITLVYRIIM